VEEVKGCDDDRRGDTSVDKDINTLRRSVTSTTSMKSLATSQPFTGGKGAKEDRSFFFFKILQQKKIYNNFYKKQDYLFYTIIV
jgi:hypothetical protein